MKYYVALMYYAKKYSTRKDFNSIFALTDNLDKTIKKANHMIFSEIVCYDIDDIKEFGLDDNRTADEIAKQDYPFLIKEIDEITKNELTIAIRKQFGNEFDYFYSNKNLNDKLMKLKTVYQSF